MSSLYYRVQNGGWWLVLAKYSYCYGKAIIMILFSIILHYEARSRYPGDISFLLSQYHICLTFKGLAVSLLTLFFDEYIPRMSFSECFTSASRCTHPPLCASVLISIPLFKVLHVQHHMTRKGAHVGFQVNEEHVSCIWPLCVSSYPKDCNLYGIMGYLSLCSYACTSCTSSDGYWEDAEPMKYPLHGFQLNSDLYKWIPWVQFI